MSSSLFVFPAPEKFAVARIAPKKNDVRFTHAEFPGFKK
jgi:hypothetical protein